MDSSWVHLGHFWITTRCMNSRQGFLWVGVLNARDGENNWELAHAHWNGSYWIYWFTLLLFFRILPRKVLLFLALEYGGKTLVWVLCRYAACVIWILPKLSLEFLLTRLWLFFLHVFPSRRETLASCAGKCMPGFRKPSQSWDSDISDCIIRWCLMIQVGRKLRIRFDLCTSVENTNDTTWWEHNTSCLLSQHPFWLQTSGHGVNPLDASVESIRCWLRVRYFWCWTPDNFQAVNVYSDWRSPFQFQHTKFILDALSNTFLPNSQCDDDSASLGCGTTTGFDTSPAILQAIFFANNSTWRSSDTTWYNTSSQNSLLQFLLFFCFGHNTTAKLFKLSELSKLFSCPCDSESECSEAPGVSMARGTMFHHVFAWIYRYAVLCRDMPILSFSFAMVHSRSLAKCILCILTPALWSRHEWWMI